MLHKSFELVETKALEGDDIAPGTFEAVVAVFNNVDKQGDRIKETAFDDTLAKWQDAGDPIPVILSHDHQNAWAHVGVADPKDVKVVPGRGLYAKGVLDVDTNPLAAQVYRLMKRRSLKEFSFGYRVPPGGEKKARDGAFDLLKLDLIEFGPTLSGANPDTELLAVKSDLERQAESTTSIKVVALTEEERAELVGRIDSFEKRLEALEGKDDIVVEEEPEDESDESDQPEEDEPEEKDEKDSEQKHDDQAVLVTDLLKRQARRWVDPYLDDAA